MFLPATMPPRYFGAGEDTGEGEASGEEDVEEQREAAGGAEESSDDEESGCNVVNLTRFFNS